MVVLKRLNSLDGNISTEGTRECTLIRVHTVQVACKTLARNLESTSTLAALRSPAYQRRRSYQPGRIRISYQSGRIL